MPEISGPPDELPPHYNSHNNILLKCTFIDVDHIGGYSWRFVLPLDAVKTWRSLCDKLSTCLSLIRDLEGVPYPVETTFWAKDLIADGFICKEDWEQLVYGGGKYELVFRGNSRIKQPPRVASNRSITPSVLSTLGAGAGNRTPMGGPEGAAVDDIMMMEEASNGMMPGGTPIVVVNGGSGGNDVGAGGGFVGSTNTSQHQQQPPLPPQGASAAAQQQLRPQQPLSMSASIAAGSFQAQVLPRFAGGRRVNFSE
ncbi:hypothetical protein DFH27DRAFT_397602 [Peziza echinospora]|nr:hypothetical protein DFH27DRAFT_397602 [Peziza echinospora]